jgi:acetaldehyde dehydrogenase/alcohol dehydrogenase
MVLPYTVEFTAGMAAERYADLARFVGFEATSPSEAVRVLAGGIRALARTVGQPLSLADAGVSASEFEAALPKLVENAECDACLVVSPRIPDTGELERLYRYVFEGRSVDF